MAQRYRLPDWTPESHAAPERPDRQAAASEAVHVIGCAHADIRHSLGITAELLERDPVLAPVGMQPWEPWPPRLAACVFLDTLRGLRGQAAAEPALGSVTELVRWRHAWLIGSLAVRPWECSKLPEQHGHGQDQPGRRPMGVVDVDDAADPAGVEAR